MNWHSVHIYHRESQDDLLVSCVGPQVASLRTAGSARWFYLRHWARGLHVRLRLRLEGSLAGLTLQGVQAALLEYVRRKPSRVALPPDELVQQLNGLAQSRGHEADSRDVVPNNSVRIEPYEPEHGKYGGPIGVDEAERLFESSSDLALEVLQLCHGRARALGLSFSMMIAAVSGAGLKDGSLADFLAAYCRFWLRYTFHESIVNWPARLAEGRSLLSGCAVAVLSARRHGELSHVWDYVIRWQVAVRSTMATLDANAAAILPNVTMIGPKATSERRREFVLLNYIHTHNNRLGIPLADEAYVAYLAHHIVCQIEGIVPHDMCGRVAR